MKYPDPSLASPHPSNAGKTASPAPPNGCSGRGSLAGPWADADIAHAHTAARAAQASSAARGSFIGFPLSRTGFERHSLLLLLREPGAARLDLGEIVRLVEIRDVQPDVI